ncbi:hypothetical protein EDC04DRAFT_3082815 [Pisolithus marmoratus]|nr:hypothetical protein EDC04DRAFT_3082815 [Pisolithus marmoratus]
MNKLLVMSDGRRNEVRGRTGYKKIINTCKQAQNDGLEWVWIDTCCIDKKSSPELSEAINSMYNWYANAEVCYAYLHDTEGDSWQHCWMHSWEHRQKLTPKWFSRGWTLQELIAPRVVHFFDQKWQRIGDKAELAWPLSNITRIPAEVLKKGLQKESRSVNDHGRPSVAQIFSWAADRTTTREEDRAYSLLGLLGVHMPMLYGEGKNAFRRLQLEMIRTSNDQSIFAWGWTRKFGWSGSILADGPSCFRDCDRVTALKPEQFTERLRDKGMTDDALNKSTQEQLRTFTVTNDGIQIWLPTATFGSLSQVTLGCWDQDENDLMTIHLPFLGSTRFRTFGITEYPRKMKFQQHLLPYKETEYPTFTFKLQDQTLSHDGFVMDHDWCVGVEVKDGSVTLSSDNDFAAIAYLRGKDTRFLVLLSYSFGGQASTFAIVATKDFKWELVFLRLRALKRLFNSNHKPRRDDKHLMQHIHIPGSIQSARVVHSVPSDSSVGCTVTIDIAKCSGCCAYEERSRDHVVETPRIPGLMWNCLRGELPQPCHLSEHYPVIPFPRIESEFKPGDYGRVPQNGDKFRPEGNIIEFATCLGLGPFEDDIRGIRLPELESVQPWRSLLLSVPGHGNSHHLDMYDGTGWTLQANQQVVLLLKALSSRLAGRLLVTTVIRYSDPLDLCPRLYSTFAPRNRLDLDAWEPLLRFPPLCLVVMPMTWCQTFESFRLVDIDQELMTMLLKIIDTFSVLVGWVSLPLTLGQITSFGYLLGGQR